MVPDSPAYLVKFIIARCILSLCCASLLGLRPVAPATEWKRGCQRRPQSQFSVAKQGWPRSKKSLRLTGRWWLLDSLASRRPLRLQS
ncbi:hypothetical protein C8R47DRAFT_1127116 [Mycena vitilis]|nr:hypothetical protein C8R47DRAFT_1127116 [Mycena vitilis]